MLIGCFMKQLRGHELGMYWAHAYLFCFHFVCEGSIILFHVKCLHGFVEFSLYCHIFGAIGEINFITLHEFYINKTGFKRLNKSWVPKYLKLVLSILRMESR